MDPLSLNAETPVDEMRAQLLASITTALGDALVESHMKPGADLWIRVRTDAWRQSAVILKEQLNFDYFSFLSAIDWMPSPYGKGEEDPTAETPERDTTIRQGYAGGDTRLQVFARIVNHRTHVGITMKADVPDADATSSGMSVESWTGVFSGANWHEREAHEMFGISFAGHPDLRNMYLPKDFEGYPMRKDFPLLARMVKPWPGIVDVEPLPGGDADDSATNEEGASQ